MTKKARKPIKPQAKTPGKRLPPVVAAAPAVAASRRKLLWVTLTAAATGLGLHAGIQGLRQVAGSLPENRLRMSMLQVTPQPPWVTVDLTKKILADAGFDLATAKLTDPDLLTRLAAAFEESPWVSSVRIKAGVRTLHVDAAYRKPVLSIPWKGWACYLSADGVVLPPDPETDKQAFRRCLVLEGFRDVPPPHVGERFTDPTILAAASLAEALGESVDRMNLLSVAVTADGVTLTTIAGSKIKWGRYSAGDDPLEFRHKAAKLETACDATHQLDGPGAPFFYDLTTEARALVGQPMAKR
jgi:hypothetical protein